MKSKNGPHGKKQKDHPPLKCSVFTIGVEQHTLRVVGRKAAAATQKKHMYQGTKMLTCRLSDREDSFRVGFKP